MIPIFNSNQKKNFTQYPEGSDWVVIPWNTRLAGQILIGLTILGVVVFVVIQVLDGKLWDAGELVGNALMVGLLVYIGTACLRNRTLVRVKPDGNVHLSYGPQPLLPGVKINRGNVQAYWETGSSHATTFWRVDLITQA